MAVQVVKARKPAVMGDIREGQTGELSYEFTLRRETV